MKFGNFTGPNIDFIGGFSGGSYRGMGTRYNVSDYKFAGSFAVGATETLPTGMFFKPDGTRFFIIGSTTDRLRSWDLSTAWDITTATNPIAMSGTLNDGSGVALTSPANVSISDDGLYAFVTDDTNNALYRYTLGTAWDITTITANADQTNTAIWIGRTGAQGAMVAQNGLSFLLYNSTTAALRVATTTIANDITTLNVTSTVGALGPVGVCWAGNGSRIILVRSNDDTAVSYLASPAYSTNITTLSTLALGSYDTTPQDIFMKDDGTSFYYLGSSTDTIYQFNF